MRDGTRRGHAAVAGSEGRIVHLPGLPRCLICLPIHPPSVPTLAACSGAVAAAKSLEAAQHTEGHEGGHDGCKACDEGEHEHKHEHSHAADGHKHDDCSACKHDGGETGGGGAAGS